MADTQAHRVAGSIIAAAGGKSWDATCDVGLLQQSNIPNILTLRLHDVPNGNYEYKVAVDGNWDTSYGEAGRADPGCPNIKIKVKKTSDVVFYFETTSHRTRNEIFTKEVERTAKEKRLSQQRVEIEKMKQVKDIQAENISARQSPVNTPRHSATATPVRRNSTVHQPQPGSPHENLMDVSLGSVISDPPTPQDKKSPIHEKRIDLENLNPQTDTIVVTTHNKAAKEGSCTRVLETVKSALKVCG